MEILFNAFYSKAFGTDTKMAELIEMPFEMTTWVDPIDVPCVRWGTPPPMGRGNIGGNVAAHCKVMGHYTVSCPKRAEPIKMPFWTKTWVCRRNHVLDGGADLPQRRGNFGGCPSHLNALAIFAAASRSRSLQKGSFNRQ